MARLASRSKLNGLRLAFPGAGIAIPPEENDGSEDRKRIFQNWNHMFRIRKYFACAIRMFGNLPIHLRA